MLIQATFEGAEVLILDMKLGKITGVEGTGTDILCVIFSDIATGIIQYSVDPSAFTIIE